MSMLAALQAKDKSGLFTKTPTDISYPTGFHILDHRNGYWLESYNQSNEVIGRYKSLGIVAGSINTVIGKSGVAKTTGVVQWAEHIIRPFPNAMIAHYDAENAYSYTRIHQITGRPIHELRTNYLLKKDMTSIEDIQESIMDIYEEKISNPKKYKYKSGVMDEFGEEIELYEPTVIIIDSLPSLSLRESKEAREMETQSYGARKARAFSEFCSKLTPLCKQANIIMFFINHIKVKMSMSFVPQQAQQMYLKQDETLPLGEAPIYYANNIFRFISSTKFKKDKDGFDGFLVKVELIKSRTNKAGQVAELVYDQARGFDNARTLLHFAESMKQVTGRNPYRHFLNHSDVKFNSLKFSKQYNENKDLRMALAATTLPFLDSLMSSYDETLLGDSLSNGDIMNYLTESINKNEDGFTVEDIEKDLQDEIAEMAEMN